MAIRNLLPDVFRGERGNWNPSREINRLQQKIDRVFDDFFQGNESFPSLLGSTRELVPLEGDMGFTPACDIEETDTQYVVTFDLPGVKKDEVKIDLQNNQLTVSGERKEETNGRKSRELYYGSFCRSFTLPSNVEAENVEANYKDGVLQIALPKSAVSTGKQIPIKEGKVVPAKSKKAA
jgi:HSP20 family protein